MRLWFSGVEANQAAREWGCNCGPGALACILGITLDEVRPIVEAVGFADKQYMNPTMMQQSLGKKLLCKRPVYEKDRSQTQFPYHGLARIQWTGPWTAAGANPKWAYGNTHWIASGGKKSGEIEIFDINSGMVSLKKWIDETVPFIVKDIQRADGGWFITHCWEVALDAAEKSG